MSWFLLILALSSLGFFALASTMLKHQKQIFSQELDSTKTKIAQSVGWILLILSLALCIHHSKLSIGISYWVGALTIAALIVGLSLSYYAAQIKNIAYALLVVLIISSIVNLI